MTERRVVFGVAEVYDPACDGCGKIISAGQGTWINRYVGLQTKRYYVHAGGECAGLIDIALRK